MSNRTARRLRAIVERYRKWRADRQRERLHRFIAWASQPERVAAREEENEWTYGRLFLTDVGFRLEKGGKCEYDVRWEQILEIQTYKHDFFSYDMICLAFRIGAEEWVEAWESMPGFMALAERMQEAFPSVPADWFGVVMHPAFAPNQRTLWVQSES